MQDLLHLNYKTKLHTQELTKTYSKINLII